MESHGQVAANGKSWQNPVDRQYTPPEALVAVRRVRYSLFGCVMQDELRAVAKKYGIRLLLRFGSSVTGKTHVRSDVDIAALLDRPTISFQEHGGLLHDLQRLFPEREVDLALINHADPLFLKKITDDCEILYGPVEELLRLKIYAFKRYQDHRKYFEMERRFAARFVATTAPAE